MWALKMESNVERSPRGRRLNTASPPYIPAAELGSFPPAHSRHSGRVVRRLDVSPVRIRQCLIRAHAQFEVTFQILGAVQRETQKIEGLWAFSAFPLRVSLRTSTECSPFGLSRFQFQVEFL